MLQFYFLSVMCNLLAGLTLSSDWFARKLPTLTMSLSAIGERRGKLLIGLATLCVGFTTLFVPTEPPLVLGDLVPSLAGMIMGVALLFEVFKQDALLPAESAEKNRPDRVPIAYRTTLGALGIAAAILHFFLPERLLL